MQSNSDALESKSDLREYLWELVGLEEKIEALKEDEKISLPMIHKDNNFYDLDISLFLDKTSQKLFLATLQTKNDTTQNYADSIKEMNKKTLIYELSDEKNEHLYYQQINKRLFVLHVDLDGIITQVNDVCCHFFNLTSDNMEGEHFSKFFHPQKASSSMESHIFVAQNSFGNNLFFHADIIPLTNNNKQVTHNIIIAQDVSYLKQINKELEYVSYHDALTGLPNQDYFLKSLDNYLQQNSNFAFCLLNINNFSTVNEEYGAHGGDMLLKHFSELISNVCEKNDTVMRLRADLFVLLFEIDKTKEYIGSTVDILLQTCVNTPLPYTKEDIITFSCRAYIYHHQDNQLLSHEILNYAKKELQRVR